jgi:hypothetical protein
MAEERDRVGVFPDWPPGGYRYVQLWMGDARRGSLTEAAKLTRNGLPLLCPSRQISGTVCRLYNHLATDGGQESADNCRALQPGNTLVPPLRNGTHLRKSFLA